MNRELFMRDLARFLSDIPAEEREQALHYYDDYFEDAGAENEQSVIEELGSPVDVAKQIKSVNREQISYGEGSARKNIAYPKVAQEDSSQTGSQNFQNNNSSQGGFQNNNYGNQANFSGTPYGNQQNYSSQANSGKASWTESPGKVTLVIVLAILAIPVGLPLLSAVFGVAVAVIACLFSLFVSLFAVGGALIISGIAGIVCTVFAAASGHFASSILALGFSLILISVGAFLLWLGVIFAGKGIPAVWKGVVSLCRSISRGFKKFFS